MTVLNSFDGENFTFPKRPVENGWVSKDGALNPEYMFVLVDVNVKKTTEGEAGQQPVLLNNLRLVRSGKDGKLRVSMMRWNICILKKRIMQNALRCRMNIWAYTLMWAVP